MSIYIYVLFYFVAYSMAQGSSDLEGVGGGRVFGNLALCAPFINSALLAGPMGDLAAALTCRVLLRREGLFVGGSAGMNVVAGWLSQSILIIILCDFTTLTKEKTTRNACSCRRSIARARSVDARRAHDA